MLAVLLTGTFDDPGVATGEVDAPADEPGKMVIEVVAAGISRMEPHWITLWQNADGTPRRQPVVLGLEFAGRVRSLGPGVQEFTIGQSVVGMTGAYENGALAEYVGTEAEHVLAMPDGLSYEDASSLPLSGLTAWQALVRYGKLQSGQRVLIHGGAGAVGTFAIQIARWIGAHVVVTASANDADLCRRLGADDVIDYRRERFEDRGGDYDLVFDQIGGDIQERSWSMLKRGGALITIAGEETDAPDQERARALGVTTLFFIVDQNVDELSQLTDLVVAGTVRPIIGQRLQLADVPKAFDRHADRFAGKVIMSRTADRERQPDGNASR